MIFHIMLIHLLFNKHWNHCLPAVFYLACSLLLCVCVPYIYREAREQAKERKRGGRTVCIILSLIA